MAWHAARPCSALEATARVRLCALQGVSKGFMPKGELSDNQWAFVGGSRVEVLPEPR